MSPSRRSAGALLVLLLVAACADSEDSVDRVSVEETTSTVTEPAPADGDLIGGSRYLVRVMVPPGSDHREVIREDLRTGEEDVVAQADTSTYDAVAVRADGAVAWAQLTAEGDDATTVYVVARPGAEPVEVDAADAGCPSWRPDGSLLVTVVDAGGLGSLALADPTSGAITEELPVDLRAPVCAVSAGRDHVVFPRPVGDDTYGPGGAEVVRAAIEGTAEEVVGRVPPSCWANDLAVSPDGTALAAGVLCGPEVERDSDGLYVGTMDDDLAPLIAENAPDADRASSYQYWGPSWSADGTVVAYYRTAGGAHPPDLWRVEVDDGTPEGLGGSGWILPALSGP